jgi:hypothetical protein
MCVSLLCSANFFILALEFTHFRIFWDDDILAFSIINESDIFRNLEMVWVSLLFGIKSFGIDSDRKRS